jgi:hypothetical protein
MYFTNIHNICLLSIFLKTNKMHQLNYNKTDHKTHFISGANSHMIQHQHAITKEFLSNKRS